MPLPEILSCPNCHNSFSEIRNGLEDSVIALLCANCQTITPVLEGIVYFHETDIYLAESSLGRVNSFRNKIETNRSNCHDFLTKKAQRPSVDAYAAFQPFNESTRAIYPFIELMRQTLQPGDWILDTWCRTGWTSNWLTSLFPEQNILSVWEGNTDILGYQGFDYWFSGEKRKANQHIIFTNLSQPLPIRTDSIKVIYGLDSLHKYKQSVFIPEMLRAISPDGISLFPHVHLTNAEPEPFFERGERQLHGKEYNSLFSEVGKKHGFQHFIMPEIALFELEEEKQIWNEPNIEPHYNAVIALLPKSIGKPILKPFKTDFSEPEKRFVLVNPLVEINLDLGTAELNKTHLSGASYRILERHPVYKARLDLDERGKLSELETKLIYWAKKAKNISEIAQLLETEVSSLIEVIKKLEKAELIQTHVLTPTAIRLFYFQAEQTLIPNPNKNTTGHLWKLAEAKFEGKNLLINEADESKLNWEDCNEIILAIQQRLASEGLQKGEVISIVSSLHFEAILTFWASTQMGLVCQIISNSHSQKTISQLLAQAKPKLIFHSHLMDLPNPTTKTIVFDEEESEIASESFSDWLYAEEETNIEIRPATENDIAVILYTSGSTGLPNGIPLTHKMLFQSAEKVANTFRWNQAAIYLATSELDSMSGLRNTALATIFAGCPIVIPNLAVYNKVFSIVESIRNQQITLLSTTPALLKQFVQLGEGIKKDISSLKTVICTAAILTKKLIEEFYELFQIKILNYYGLTETSGICLANSPDTPLEKLDSLGKSITGITQLVNELGEISEDGEFRIYGENVTSSYAFGKVIEGGTEDFRLENDWLYTQDIMHRDSEGYFHMKGRKREIVKNTNGETIYLSKIREEILRFDMVKDIFVGSFTEQAIEKVVAIVQLQKGADFTDFQKELASEIQPKLLPNKLIESAEIPYNSRGKIDKETLEMLISQS
jgi:acyl-coenzyme A synthetase/AMP-(fatty) acid ligase